MKLRKGKTKVIIESSIDAALLAVEIYNKPRTAFRSQGYITLMNIAWTQLFHAYFHHTIGDKYYYKNANGRYKLINNEKKAWELNTCIKKYPQLNEGIKANLNFFIGLRNKIEHRRISKTEVDIHIFGECQALLYNYETTLINMFGDQYSLNEHLAYSLQFSRLRTSEQERANKMVLEEELKDLKNFIQKYRASLSEEIFNTQEYSIKLIQVPKVTNTNRNDLAIEFVNWNQLSEEDRINYEKLTAIIKDKIVKAEAVNVDRLKPGVVIKNVSEELGIKFTHYDHKCFFTVFSIRPIKGDGKDPTNTNSRFCHYDVAHDDYLYQKSWIEFLIHFITEYEDPLEYIRSAFKEEATEDIGKYLS